MLRIFFDIDGVLIHGYHTRAERRHCWDENLEHDLGIKRDVFQSIFKDWDTGWFQKVITGRANLKTEMARWLQENGYGHEASEIIQYWCEKDSKLNGDVLDAVKVIAAKGHAKIYTATNQSHDRIAYLRDVLGWKNYFTDFYYSARLGCLKYDPRYFMQIEEELCFDPYQEPPLYFDDDPRNIEVSSARGWNAVLVDGPEDVVNHPVIKELLS